jgi:hypothetical protein
MGSTSKIVCLANSRKLQGRCIAGREIIGGEPGAWIRPVSDREHQEVSEYERQYEDGSDPRVLDVIRIPFLKPLPKGWQNENMLLDPEKYWVKEDKLSKKVLHKFAISSGPLWLNGYKTFEGQNDRIPLSQAKDVTSSLKLIYTNVLIRVFEPGRAFGNNKRRVQAQFQFDGEEYFLYITDPIIEREFLGGKNGKYKIGDCFLTISLGEPYQDYMYKLVAAVIS